MKPAALSPLVLRIPPRSAALSLPLVLCLLAISTAARPDTVELRDGMVLKGRVVELGGNSVEVKLREGASRRVALRDIRKATFEPAQEGIAADTDVVFRRNGTSLRGDVSISEDGKTVAVTRTDGSRVMLPRSEVARIVRRNEAQAETVGLFSLRVREDVAAALARLGGPPQEAGEAEERLKVHGIFAIAEVEEALRAARKGSPERQALGRVIKLYRLREVTPDALQDLHDYYRILSQGTVEEKRDLLEEMFTRFADESVAVGKFLVRDEGEEPAVRAWAVDLLGRMQRNRDLLDIYNDPRGGQLQLAAAIALARNRILIGAEALIEALEMEEPGVREAAIRTLRDAVGEDFDFGVHDTPSARKEAVAKWKKWWDQNRAGLQAQAESMLSGRFQPGETPERKRALESWRQGCLAWERRKYPEAEAALRAAVRTDPLFFNAQVSLGVLLYLHRDKGPEGRRMLEDLLSRRLPEMSASDTTWIHYYLGHAWELGGDLDRAELEYRRALIVDPRFFRAMAALGDLKFRTATLGEGPGPEERRALLGEAQAQYRSAIDQIERQNVDLNTLALSDLPMSVAPAFERQEHNRGIMEVKASLRRRKAELHFGLAKIRSLFNDSPRAVAEATSGIEALGDDRAGGARELLVELHNYRGFLLEGAGETPRALRDYRRVLKSDLDPKNATALEALRRLQARAAAAEAEPPADRPPRTEKKVQRPADRPLQSRRG